MQSGKLFQNNLLDTVEKKEKNTNPNTKQLNSQDQISFLCYKRIKTISLFSLCCDNFCKQTFQNGRHALSRALTAAYYASAHDYHLAGDCSLIEDHLLLIISMN